MPSANALRTSRVSSILALAGFLIASHLYAAAPIWMASEHDDLRRHSHPAGTRPVSFVVDGDSWSGNLGFSVQGDPQLRARQALYLNRFTPERFPVVLEEVRIFFGCNPSDGTGDCLGGDIDVVIIEDRDGDGTPQTGAETVAVFAEVVEVVDGVSFSVYELDPAVKLEGPGDVYVGFVPRFIETGVTELTLPAAADSTTPSQGRSWGATWLGDPPDPPTFPATEQASRPDDSGFEANLKIRAYGYEPEGLCVPDAETLCLGRDGRFAVSATFATSQGGGASGAARAHPIDLEDGGILWMINPDNPEILVKVLDACGMPEQPRFWVFFAGTTNMGFELKVVDRETGRERVYENPDLQRADAVLDTDAFATCEPSG